MVLFPPTQLELSNDVTAVNIEYGLAAGVDAPSVEAGHRPPPKRARQAGDRKGSAYGHEVWQRHCNHNATQGDEA